MITQGMVSPLVGVLRAVVDEALVGDEDRLAELVNNLHLAWVERHPVVVELAMNPKRFRDGEPDHREPWELGQSHTVLMDRLSFLLWNNNWDCRNDSPVWWWARKAQRLGASIVAERDVRLPSGETVWVDGGPRSSNLDLPTIHYETVICGGLGKQPIRPRPAPSDLATDQLLAVTHPSGSVRVIAPAGSGKTRTLTARLLHLVDGGGVEPEIVTTVAYNNRAAQELKDRLQRPRLRVRTIHSLGWAIIRNRYPKAQLVDEKGARAVIQGLVASENRTDKDVVYSYMEALRDTRICLKSPKEVARQRGDCPNLVSVYRRYREALATESKFDHDDQIFEAIKVLLSDPVLRKRWQHRCRHLLVDEFQDMTPAYLLLLRLLASPELNVFGVGDDDQAIYGYAGADPSLLIEFDYHFPGAGLVALGTNYRCPKGVVISATNLLSHNRWRVEKKVAPAAGARKGGFRTVSLQQRNLASATAKRIAGWIDQGVPPAGIAVLGRVNVALLPVMAALDSQGVPFHSYLGEDMLHRRAFVRTVLAWIRIVRSPHVINRKDLMDALRRPNRGLAYKVNTIVPKGSITLSAMLDIEDELGPRLLQRWERFLSDLGLVGEKFRKGDTVAFLDALYHQVGLVQSATKSGLDEKAMENSTHSDDLEALMRTGYIYPRILDFESELWKLLSAPNRTGVNISSIHRVKGLEWDRVVVFGADEGLLPHRLTEDIEGERRVFHVAITRSREETVVISEAGRESRFLEDALLIEDPPEATTGDLFGDWA